jgi:Dolichyl-phosphate-mannose-protein mannosyltransferase
MTAAAVAPLDGTAAHRGVHADGRLASLAAWCAVGLVILAAAAIRLRLLDVPLERDEGEYAYQGALVLSGIPPYRMVYTQKLPGTHLVYALSMAVFGQTIPGARVALVIATAATALGVFLLGRRFFSPIGAGGAAVAYALLSLSTEMLGPFGHATHFVALFGVWGLLALSAAIDRGGDRLYLVSGFLLGLGVLMKQHGAFFVAAAAVWIATGPAGRRLRSLGIVLAGSALPFVLIGLWFAVTGSLGDAWFWVVRYASAYGSMQSLPEGWKNLVAAASGILPQALLLWLMAAGGAALLLIRRFPGTTRLRLGALLVLSFLAVCPGLYFREHYFLLFLPAAALLVGASTEACAAIRGSGTLIASIAVLVACGQALWSQREIFFRASPDEVSRLIYAPNLFPETYEIARYIRNHTKTDDTIVVFGSEPQIPFYAHRRSATGFVFVYPLMQTHGDTHRMQERMVREVESARPAYAVLIKTPTSWLEQPDSDHYMQDWAVGYLDRNYTLAGQVLVTDRGSRYLWDEAALQTPIGDASQALVMRRRDLAPGR